MVEELIATDGRLAVTEPIVMEVLSGARSAGRESESRRLLQRFSLLRFDPAADFDGATSVYRCCRATDVTPRGLIDCMVAAVVLRTGSSILAHDADLGRVARVMGIEMDAASLRASRRAPPRG